MIKWKKEMITASRFVGWPGKSNQIVETSSGRVILWHISWNSSIIFVFLPSASTAAAIAFLFSFSDTFYVLVPWRFITVSYACQPSFIHWHILSPQTLLKTASALSILFTCSQLIKLRDKKVSPARGRGVVITLVMATSIITKPAAILMDIARVIYEI